MTLEAFARFIISCTDPSEILEDGFSKYEVDCGLLSVRFEAKKMAGDSYIVRNVKESA